MRSGVSARLVLAAMTAVCGCARDGFRTLELAADYDLVSDGDAPNADSDVGPIVLTVEPVYPALADWNDYVRYESVDVDAYHQPGTACAGDETGVLPCLHGGELRRVVVPGLVSCAELVLRDALGLFAWECQDASGEVSFYSSRLASGRGLADLLSAHAWSSNVVVLTDASGALIGQSAPAVWGWTNPIVDLPDNASTSAVELTQAGAIYYASASRASNGYNLAADRIGVVVAPAATVSYGGSAAPNADGVTALVASADMRAQLAAGGRRFLWIEGRFDAAPSAGTVADVNLLLSGVRISRVHRFTAENAGTNALELRVLSQSNHFTNVTIRRPTGIGFSFQWNQNHYNRVDRLIVEGAGETGLWVTATNGDFGLFTDITASDCNRLSDGGGVVIASDDNRVYGVRVHDNNYHGLRLHGHGNVVVGVTAANNAFAGVREWNTSADQVSNNTVVDLVSINNGGAAIYAQVGTNSTYAHVTGLNGNDGVRIGVNGSTSANHTFVNVFTANTTAFGLALESEGPSVGHLFESIGAAHVGTKSVNLRASGHTFSGHLWVSDEALNCDVGGATDRGVLQDTCTDSGIDLSSTYAGLTAGPSDAVLHLAVNVAASFVGKVGADATNASGASGSAAADAITDWVNFDNRFRGWGLDGPAFPSANQAGRCTTGTCRIWDVRLRSDDTQLRDAFGAFVADGPCPASVSGATAVVVTDQQTTPNTFLAHAVEKIFDSSGDDDGLCESGETCIYAPNAGAYRGEGTLAACTFTSSGTISGVTILGYEVNGVRVDP